DQRFVVVNDGRQDRKVAPQRHGIQRHHGFGGPVHDGSPGWGPEGFGPEPFSPLTGECSACCTTRHESKQHFCRFGVKRAWNSSSICWALKFLISSTVLPSMFSISIDADAWLMQQPSPSNHACLTTPSLSICSSTCTTSPHSG